MLPIRWTSPYQQRLHSASRALDNGRSDRERLKAREVTEVVAVRCVSSHSSIIRQYGLLVRFAFRDAGRSKMFASNRSRRGSRRLSQSPSYTRQGQATDAMMPTISAIPIVMAPALDHHATVADLLTSRAASISTNPSAEVLVLFAHGPVPDEENKRRLQDMNLLAERTRLGANYARVECLTLQDDADDPMRRKRHETIKRDRREH